MMCLSSQHISADTMGYSASACLVRCGNEQPCITGMIWVTPSPMSTTSPVMRPSYRQRDASEMRQVRYRWLELLCNPEGTSGAAAHCILPREPKPTLTIECQHRLDMHLHSCKAIPPEHGVHHLPPAQHMRCMA